MVEQNSSKFAAWLMFKRTREQVWNHSAPNCWRIGTNSWNLFSGCLSSNYRWNVTHLFVLAGKDHRALRMMSQKQRIVCQTTFFLKIGPNPVPGSNPPKTKMPRLWDGFDFAGLQKIDSKGGEGPCISGFFSVKYGTLFGKNHSQWRCYKLVLVSGSVPED